MVGKIRTFGILTKMESLNMSILDRICILLGDDEQQKLTNHLGLKKTAFSDWKSGKSNSYRKYLVEIAEFFNVSLDYLVFGKEISNIINLPAKEKELLNYFKELDDYGKGRVIGKAEELAEAARRKREIEVATKAKSKTKVMPFPEPDLSDDEDDEDEEEYIEIPFAELPVSAGTGVYLHSDSIDTIKVAANDKNRKADFAIKVSGNSMEPRFCNGDIVLVREQPVEVGEIGIFVYEGEGYIKELGENRLISINPDYEDIHIKDPDSLFCQGKVISVLRLGKKKQ